MTLCKYAEQGLFISSTSEGHSQVAMCCWQSREKFIPPLRYDNGYLNKLRTDFQQGKLPSQCNHYCSISGHGSNEREYSLSDSLWPESDEKKIVKLHLEQSLTCNLKCISCGPNWSSAWNSDYHHFDSSYPPNLLYKNPEKVWQHLDLSSLIHLQFTGGEPLLNKDNKKILQHLNNIGRLPNVCISYNTNATVFPDKETIQLWSKAKFVRLFLSLDGIESTFEYTRYPAKWEQVLENIRKFQAITECCVIIEVTFTTGVHNLFNLPDFFEWWENTKITGSHGDESKVFIKQIEAVTHGGKSLRLKNLPSSLQSQAIEMLQHYSNYRGVNGILKAIQNLNQTNSWLEYLIKLDEIRNTNFRKQLPNQLSQFYLGD